MPTHAPHWVAPNVLVTNLLDNQVTYHKPAVADLTPALARTAHANPTIQWLLSTSQLWYARLSELLA